MTEKQKQRCYYQLRAHANSRRAKDKLTGYNLIYKWVESKNVFFKLILWNSINIPNKTMLLILVRSQASQKTVIDSQRHYWSRALGTLQNKQRKLTNSRSSPSGQILKLVCFSASTLSTPIPCDSLNVTLWHPSHPA